MHVADAGVAFENGVGVAAVAAGAGEHHVVAGHDGIVRKHVVAAAGPDAVGDDLACEAPFVTWQFGAQCLGGGAPGGADAGEFGHQARAVGVLDGQFERTGVDLAQGLLVAPVGGTVSIGVLRVEHVVLGVYVCAFALHAAHFGRAHQAGEGRIFGEVFEVAAAEWGAVRVHGRRVHTDDAPGERLIGVGGAHLLDQFHVPGHAHEHFGGIGVHLGAGEVETVESLRAVDVGGGLLADRFDGGGLPTGVAGQFDEFVDAHLLHELIPLLVVVVHAGHVVDLEAVVGTGGRRRIVGGIGIVGGQYGGTRPVGFEAFLDLGRDRRRIQAAFDFREGARQIRARRRPGTPAGRWRPPCRWNACHHGRRRR